jgi:uncharacterized DUF497 family protein
VANLRKHGISFEAAVLVFEGFVLEQQDQRFDHEEIRQTAIGVFNGAEIYIVFTDVTHNERRIISARRANRKERQDYWQAYQRNV